MATSFNRSAQALIDAVVRDHPDWASHAYAYGPDEDREAEPRSVKFSIPVPRRPDQRLEIALRGGTIEIAYDCGTARAEQQFVFQPDEVGEAIEDVRRFLRRFRAGDIVVLRVRLGRLARALRQDGASEVLSFRTATESQISPHVQSIVLEGWPESDR